MPDGNGMTASFTLELDDWLNFNMYHLRNSPSARRIRNGMWIGVPIGFFFFAFVLGILSSGTSNRFLYAVVFAAAGFLRLAFYRQYYNWGMRRRVRKFLDEGDNEGLLGPQEVILSPNSIVARNDETEGKSSWKNVKKVVVTDDYVFVYVSSMSAFILPRRSFKAEISFDELGEMCQKYYKEAHAQLY